MIQYRPPPPNGTFYVEASIGSSIKGLKAGTGKYGDANSPPTVMSELKTDSNSVTPFLKIGKDYENYKVDLSYYRFDYGTTTWTTTSFNEVDGNIFYRMTGKLHSDTFFLSTYYKYKPKSTPDLKPYIGIGIGQSWNHMNETAMSDDDQTVFATIFGNTKINTSYKVDIGFDYDINKKSRFNFNTSLLNIGDFQSANSQRYFFPTSIETIAPYEIINKFVPIYSAGLTVNF